MGGRCKYSFKQPQAWLQFKWLLESVMLVEVGCRKLCFNVLQVLSGTKDLQRLVIRYANLTGSIPCELFTDHKIKTIMLSFNGITGSLPACVLEVGGTQAVLYRQEWTAASGQSDSVLTLLRTPQSMLACSLHYRELLAEAVLRTDVATLPRAKKGIHTYGWNRAINHLIITHQSLI
jgi:hypothetical protein